MHSGRTTGKRDFYLPLVSKVSLAAKPLRVTILTRGITIRGNWNEANEAAPAHTRGDFHRTLVYDILVVPGKRPGDIAVPVVDCKTCHFAARIRWRNGYAGYRER